MRINSSRPIGAAVPTVVAVALALGAGGCGGSDGDEASADRPTGPEAEVRATHAKFITALYAKDAAGACSTMTRKAQNQMAPGNRTCARQLEPALKSVALLPKRPRITKVVADGDQMKASVSTGIGRPTPLWFAKEQGVWKINAGLQGQ